MLHALASDPELARASHVPLLAGTDERFAERAVEEWESATQFTFVVAEGDALWGSVLLEIDARRARLSYWIGRPFWNRGAATRAVREAIHFAFAQLRLKEVRAIAFHDNAASQRVLLKNGFTIAPPLETERDVQHALSGSSIVAYRLVRGDIAKGSIAVTLQALLDGYSKIYGMPPITLDANGSKVDLWEVSKATGNGSNPELHEQGPGTLLVFVQHTGADRFIAGLGFVVVPEAQTDAEKIMSAVQSLKGAP